MLLSTDGEFTAQYDDLRFGIPSPIEQSQRHARILQRLLKNLDIGNRMGGEMNFFHVVMLHPKAIIERPERKAFDTRNVIKADQFPSWHKQFVDKEIGVTDTLKLMVNVRGLDTIQEWAKKLKRQHRPADLLTLPEFMRPEPARVAVALKAPVAVRAEPVLASVSAPAAMNAPVPVPAPVSSAKCAADESASAPNEAAAVATDAAPSCPRCGKAMVKRIAKKGADPGSYFWGCSGYPKGCRGTRSIDAVEVVG